MRNLEEEIKRVVEKIEDVEWDIKYLKDSTEASNWVDDYNEMLDTTWDYFMGTYEPSVVLKKIDPKAYKEGLTEYMYDLECSFKCELKELQEELANLQLEQRKVI